MQAQILKRPDGTNIAYLHTNAGQGKATVVFLHGLWSDKRATKAEHIANFCESNNIELIRFDAYAHGESDGNRDDFTINHALTDALQVIDTLTGNKPVIFMGSSMGGWVSLRVMQERPNRLAGLIGIAAAPDFTKLQEHLTQEERTAHGYSNALINEGPKEFVLDKTWNFQGPVHLIQGMKDESVNWETAEIIASKLPADNVTLKLIEQGDHRLNRPEDLDAQTDSLMEIYKSI